MRLPVTSRKLGGSNYCYLILYRDWLEKQHLLSNTKRVYQCSVKQFLLYVDCAKILSGPINSRADMEIAASAFINFLKQSVKSGCTINAHVTALTNFSQFLGTGSINNVQRQPQRAKAARLLSVVEWQRLLACIDREKSRRDKALALMLCFSGLRIGDCARLCATDIGANAACLRNAEGKIVLLNGQCRAALIEWLKERQSMAMRSDCDALWLTPAGTRLSISGIARVVKRIGDKAQLEISVETLRRNYEQATKNATRENQMFCVEGLTRGVLKSRI